ncbi:hypothetical protein ACOICT_29690, partial [Klebsiella pneumoniae]|uniref:hypothetical protein n=1 Tax=Klebsiella pneumoniae TaxID=573 RepID=UPI003B5ADDBC
SSINTLQTVNGFSYAQALAFIENSLNLQAVMLGLDDIFWFSMRGHRTTCGVPVGLREPDQGNDQYEDHAGNPENII